jgi:DUF4097 and DUF4098 domain-containing protein YvlB
MGIYTSSGIKMVFSDKEGDVSLHIETPGGHKIDLADKGKSITLEDLNGNKISMEKGGITLSSCKDITLDAGTGKISLSAGGGPINLSASAGDVVATGLNVNCEAKMSFTAKGNTMASLQSSALAEVKGALVKIN